VLFGAIYKHIMTYRVRNRAITRRKLPQLRCYHIFSIELCQKSLWELFSQMVTAAQIWGS